MQRSQAFKPPAMTPAQIKAEAAKYSKTVEWSDEDGVFIGTCPELFGGGCHGPDRAKVYAELCEIIEEWVELLHDPKILSQQP